MNTPLILIFGIIISIAFIIISSRRGVHPFFSLFIAAIFFGFLAGLPAPTILQSIASGFGSLMGQIGFIVAFGTVLGNALERTGAMAVISTSILNIVGQRRAVLALTLIGGVVGIPVFCDSGFIILSRMIPSLVKRSSATGASLSVALASGLYTTHTLVPPTPGPLAAASNLGVAGSIGSVIGLGLVISIPVLAVSYLFAQHVARDADYRLNEVAEQSPESMSALKAWLPLLLPLLLIGLGSALAALTVSDKLSGVISFVTSPAIALFLGILVAVTLIPGQSLKGTDWISGSLKEAGLILLITGAGGAFGAVIKASGIDQVISAMTGDEALTGFALIFSAWLIAAILKTAQGSTTSAMIVSSSLIAPLVPVPGPVLLPLLLVFAVGGGAMTVSHANDSYFWVVSQFGGLSTKDTIRKFTSVTFVQGVTVLLMVVLVYAFAA